MYYEVIDTPLSEEELRLRQQDMRRKRLKDLRRAAAAKLTSEERAALNININGEDISDDR